MAWWWKKKQKEDLPWYRLPNYKGNLTEDEKRELDYFRHREKIEGETHPADRYDLPEHVGMYVSGLEIARYDEIQERLVGRCFLWSAIGIFVLANHFGWISLNYRSTEMLMFGAVALIVPWFYYPIKWRKNADQYMGSDTHQEEIRKEWELDYIVSRKRKRSDPS
ncbi:hypothetical protein JQ543_05035 [Bradyrhizobium diazoefficiens]|nr:hypothetical protein [Bradyrhizobium diazoefficiens]MBR0847105.1 hypothetical protein [Bradyrhizobium diazoefficiens]